MANVYGRLPFTPDHRDYKFTLTRAAWTGAFVDLSAGFPDDPYDQGQLGSCVSNGTAAAVDYARVKQGLQPLRPPSRLFIYYQGRLRAGYPLDQDSGLQIRDGFSVIAKDGAPAEALWPYIISKFTEKPDSVAYDAALLDEAVAYGQVDSASIDATLESGYPVVFGFDVYASFEGEQTRQTGVMPVPDTSTEQLMGGHCVVLCSTPQAGENIPGADSTKAYYLVRNSWGHDGSWGIPTKPGYFWMPYEVVHSNESSDFWVVTTMSDPNTPKPVNHSPFDAVISHIREEWREFDQWLIDHGII